VYEIVTLLVKIFGLEYAVTETLSSTDFKAFFVSDFFEMKRKSIIISPTIPTKPPTIPSIDPSCIFDSFRLSNLAGLVEKAGDLLQYEDGC
jgi:hypothetical protein